MRKHWPTCGGRQCAGIVLLLACMVHGAAFAQVPLSSGRVTGTPPLYRRIPLQRPLAQSMVYGPGTIDGGPLQRPDPPAASRPVVTPQCQHGPQQADLHAYSGLESVTAAQARDLGIVLRSRNGEAKPFLTGPIVLWRSGRYAVCNDEAQRPLVYGAEWAVAFLMQGPARLMPVTITELSSRIQQGNLLAFGWMVNGGNSHEQLDEHMNGLAAAWSTSEEMLRQRFGSLRGTWPPDKMSLNLATPIGIAAP